MAETPGFLAERLKVEGEKTIAFFDDLSPSQWQVTVYTEGETWTIRNVLAHFVTAEKGFLTLFKSIRDGGSGASEDFDINWYNASQQRKTVDLSPMELIEQYKHVREQMISLVESFTAEDLLKHGRHPFLGETSLLEMIKMVYRHNQIHHRDLRKLLQEK